MLWLLLHLYRILVIFSCALTLTVFSLDVPDESSYRPRCDWQKLDSGYILDLDTDGVASFYYGIDVCGQCDGHLINTSDTLSKVLRHTHATKIAVDSTLCNNTFNYIHPPLVCYGWLNEGEVHVASESKDMMIHPSRMICSKEDTTPPKVEHFLLYEHCEGQKTIDLLDSSGGTSRPNCSRMIVQCIACGYSTPLVDVMHNGVKIELSQVISSDPRCVDVYGSFTLSRANSLTCYAKINAVESTLASATLTGRAGELAFCEGKIRHEDLVLEAEEGSSVVFSFCVQGQALSPSARLNGTRAVRGLKIGPLAWDFEPVMTEGQLHYKVTVAVSEIACHMAGQFTVSLYPQEVYRALNHTVAIVVKDKPVPTSSLVSETSAPQWATNALKAFSGEIQPQTTTNSTGSTSNETTDPDCLYGILIVVICIITVIIIVVVVLIILRRKRARLGRTAVHYYTYVQ